MPSLEGSKGSAHSKGSAQELDYPDDRIANDDVRGITLPQDTIDSFWDLAYKDGDHLEYWESAYTPAELVTAVAAGLIPTGARALDIGCGAGSEVVFLAEQGFRAIGVDSSRQAIEIARAKAAEARVDAEFHHADATLLPVPDQSIDFASDRGCLHVISQESRRQYARELHRVLKPGARFLLRGAAEADEEEGVLAVDASEIDRVFSSQGFSAGPIVSMTLVAVSGTLAANLVVLTRVDGLSREAQPS